MRLLLNDDNRDPCVNLALEEYCVRNLDTEDPFLLFYVNDPSIIIGKHQNTLEEINLPYVREHAIQVVRRISGGGAVYHDHGNLNFSFIKRFVQGEMLRFEEFTRPVIRALAELGIEAKHGGRNDLTVDGRKISGNAQFTTVHSMFSHGTLLFDSRLDQVNEALNVKMDKIASRSVKSVRSGVANITEFLSRPIAMERFREHLIRSVFEGIDPVPVYRLSRREWDQVHHLADSVYRQWDWNYGMSPRFNIQRVHRFPAGEIDARIDVHEGRISTIRISCDFLGDRDLAGLERGLTGVPYEPAELSAALAAADVEGLPGGLDRNEFVRFLHD
jgi:lipoate-protein ligase A